MRMFFVIQYFDVFWGTVFFVARAPVDEESAQPELQVPWFGSRIPAKMWCDFMIFHAGDGSAVGMAWEVNL